MGTGVVYGMTIATVIGLFIIPVCYVFIQGLSERGAKKKAPAQPQQESHPEAHPKPQPQPAFASVAAPQPGAH